MCSLDWNGVIIELTIVIELKGYFIELKEYIIKFLTIATFGLQYEISKFAEAKKTKFQWL